MRVTQAAARLRWPGLVLTMTLAAVAVGCATNPVTGKREISLVSESQEIEMGRQGAADVAASIGIYPDSGLQRYVRAIGLRLAAASERPNLPWSFQVVDDASVNAFALPGGFIFITRGIMAHMSDEAELASVMGHEIGHVTAKHSVQAISRQQLATLGLGVGMILSEEVRQVGDVASAGLGVLFLKYSRDAEEQADQLGFKYALQDGYDVRAMSRMFQMLERVSTQGEGGRLPQWLSSHPNPTNRLADNEARITALSRDLSQLALNRNAYVQQIDGVVYGDNPRQGYFEGSRFQHPDLKFRIDFPSGWATRNQVDAVVAGSPSDDALMSLTLVPNATSPDGAYRTFAGQQGISMGPGNGGTIGGFPAMSGTFDATTQQGTLRGDATFIQYDGRIYRILGYGTSGGYSKYSGDMRQATRSFAQLTDRAALNKQPLRVKVVRLARDMTVEDFHRTQSSAISLQQVLLLNNVDAGATLQSGTWAKRVE